MPPARKPFEPPAASDIPVLTEVVRPGDGNPLPAPALPPAETIAADMLAAALSERITAVTDRLLRDATVEIHATLVSKVWEKLREEIPAIVAAALRENGHRH